MTDKQKKRLIEALRIRMVQFTAQANGDFLAYPLHDGHHSRDVVTMLAVLEGWDNADALLANMPTEKKLSKGGLVIKKLTMADCHRERREVLKNWLHSLCRQSKYGSEAYDFPQTLDIIDAIECCPGDRLRGR